MIAISEHTTNDSGERLPADPSPQQIQRRAAAIRRRWNPLQRERRRITANRLWLPLIVQIADIEANLPQCQSN